MLVAAFRYLSPPRRRTHSKRWSGLAFVLVGLATVLLLGKVVYPRVGARVLRARVVALIEARLHRSATIDHVDVHFGHASIRGLRITGNDAPLATIGRIDVTFGGLASLFGKIEIESAELFDADVSLSARETSQVLDAIRTERGPSQSMALKTTTRLPAVVIAHRVSVRLLLEARTDRVNETVAMTIDQITASPATRTVSLHGLDGSISLARGTVRFTAGSAVAKRDSHWIER